MSFDIIFKYYEFILGLVHSLMYLITGIILTFILFKNIEYSFFMELIILFPYGFLCINKYFETMQLLWGYQK